SRQPKLIVWVDVGLNLGNLCGSIADWRHEAEVFTAVAARAQDSNVAGTARWSAIQARLAQGDVASLLDLARRITIDNPRAAQADDAIAIVRSLTSVAPAQPIALTGDERLQRALSLLRDGDPQNAFEELTALNENAVSAPLRPAVRLNRGLALARVRRYEESNKIL